MNIPYRGTLPITKSQWNTAWGTFISALGECATPKTSNQLSELIRQLKQLEGNCKTEKEISQKLYSHLTAKIGDVDLSDITDLDLPMSKLQLSKSSTLSKSSSSWSLSDPTGELDRIQYYLNRLSYNHTGIQIYPIAKTRPFFSLMETAKQMMKYGLPIKCLEAVVLASYLSCGAGFSRFPLSIKSRVKGSTFSHIVLVVYHRGRFGALGLSRKRDLMDKPLIYKSLYGLILEFFDSYRKNGHSVIRLKLGDIMPHDPDCKKRYNWKAVQYEYGSCDNLEQLLYDYEERLKSFIA